MSLMDAPAYDYAREKRKTNLKRLIAALVAAAIVIILFMIFYMPRLRARRTVDHFMAALIAKNYQEAYYLWQANPKQYPMDQFMQDWGPGSRWGIIKEYKVVELGKPPGPGPASGLVALVEINEIPLPDALARIWVENKNQMMSYYQY